MFDEVYCVCYIHKHSTINPLVDPFRFFSAATVLQTKRVKHLVFDFFTMCSTIPVIPLSVFSMCACFYSHSLWYILSTFLVLGHEYKSSGLIQISGNELCVNVKVLWSQFKVLRRVGKRIKVTSVGTRGTTEPGELETRQLCSFVISLSPMLSPPSFPLSLSSSFHSSLSLFPFPPSSLPFPHPSSTLPPLPPSPLFPPEAMQVYQRGPQWQQKQISTD